MIEQDTARSYLVGYYDAIEEVSEFLTGTLERHKNSPLPVLNSIIIHLHEERSRIMEDLDMQDEEDEPVEIREEPSEEEQLIMAISALEKAVQNIIGGVR